MRKNIFKWFLLSISIFIYGMSSGQSDESMEDLYDLSLEELMNMEITSVSKKAERFQDVAASIYVITAEDISNSTATNLHELLLSVPGYWGVQEDYNNVNSRMRYSSAENAFDGTVLFLLDGTPIQELMFSAFNFSNFSIPLHEIERIEVIKGSGGTIYGANSATGVVNIFTKSPENSKEKFWAEAKGGMPGYGELNAGLAGQLSDKWSVRAYAGIRYFEGYGYADEFDGDQIDLGDTVITNRFTEPFETTTMINGGIKSHLRISEKTDLSLGIHYNQLFEGEYTAYLLPSEYRTFGDTAIYNEVTQNRIVANFKIDHTFTENHSMFFRYSTNAENDFERLAGGYELFNRIHDFEIQDNIQLGINALSIGANFRLVKFDIHNINAPDQINYIDPQASENLKGFFVQDKISLSDKLRMTLGMKAENYSLINDKFYLSPSAKVSYSINENITLWGGFTRSYTTPGFNTTNIELTILRAPSVPYFTDQVFQSAYADALSKGADQQQAYQQAAQYVQSSEGQQVIGTLSSQYPGYFNASVINGDETGPTQFNTSEIGIRIVPTDKFYFESNLYYTVFADGVESKQGISSTLPSPTKPGENALMSYYGNYVKGEMFGSETIMRYKPSSNFKTELSYTLLHSEVSRQNIDVADESDLTQINPKTQMVPEHIIRLKGDYQTSGKVLFSLEGLYATAYNSDAEYDMVNQKYRPALLPPGTAPVIAENEDRFIMNLSIGKKLWDDAMTVRLFARDIFNSGRVESTDFITNVTYSQTSAFYGIGLTYQLK